MGNIAAIWDRIEAGIRARDSLETRSLPCGAALEDIRRVEAAIGVQLPDAVRESYQLHDGSNGIYLCEQGFLMPLIGTEDVLHREASVLNTWNGMRTIAKMMADERGEPEGPIKDDWWCLSWIPLTDNQCGDSVCLDFSPEPGGKFGQVIDWSHEEAAVRVLSDSFMEWMESLFAEPFAAE